jgi:hypothetical protein
MEEQYKGSSPEPLRESEQRPVVRQERRAGFVNEESYGPHSRWYEQTWWGKVIIWSQRFSPFVIVIITGFFAFGFNFRTPKHWFENIDNRVTTLEQTVEKTNEGATRDRAEVIERINVLIRLQCRSMSRQERNILSLCDNLRINNNSGEDSDVR